MIMGELESALEICVLNDNDHIDKRLVFELPVSYLR